MYSPDKRLRNFALDCLKPLLLQWIFGRVFAAIKPEEFGKCFMPKHAAP
jgi:hypothetical protein